MDPRTGVDARGASPIYIKTTFLNSAQSYVNRDSDHTTQIVIFEMIHYCAHCDYKSVHKWCVRRHMKTKHQNNPDHCCSCCEFNSNDVYDRRKHMKNKCARKRDLSVDEVRNIINEGFDIFQLYMKMKIQPTEVEDEERIEESIDVFKHYMLYKINE